MALAKTMKLGSSPTTNISLTYIVSIDSETVACIQKSSQWPLAHFPEGHYIKIFKNMPSLTLLKKALEEGFEPMTPK